MRNNCDAKKRGGKDGVSMSGAITICCRDMISATSRAKGPLPEESLQGRVGWSTQGRNFLRVRC